MEQARGQGLLRGRIDKPYEPYPPRKAADSARYPRIKVVETSVQNNSANYFGRYISIAVDAISAKEIAEAHEERFPTVLVIGPRQYLRQVREYLESNGYQCEPPGMREPATVRREEGLSILGTQPDANLGWRIVLEVDHPPFQARVIRESIAASVHLIEVIPAEYRDQILGEARAYEQPPEAPPVMLEVDPSRPTIKLATFEGSKGLSAQHVFVVGLHEGDLPRRSTAVNDLEVCKMIVAITRTRKQCHLVYTRRWGENWKRRSPFLDWIRPERCEFVRVSSSYW